MKKFLIILIILILIISLGSFFIYWAVYLPVDSGSQETETFLIKKGEGVKEISINLQKQGFIKLKSIFRIYVLFAGRHKELKAGNYALSKAMNIPEIAEKFSSGDIIKKQITIIEGWNLRDIGSYFEEKEISTAEEFFELTGLPAKKSAQLIVLDKEFDFLKDKPKNVNLEGYLFPDTYEVLPDASLEEIIRKILANFDKKLTPELRKEIISQNKSIFEIIIMASLIEKEVKTIEDKKIVSGILWKRIEQGMPLQVDATISYITSKKTTNVSIEETKIESLYNTYKYKGLPFGPISNPGMESIEAALQPQKSPYFYYLSTLEGETIFSETLEEHNSAKEKYLR